MSQQQKNKIPSFLVDAVGTAILALLLAQGLVHLSSSMVRSPLDALENQIVDLCFSTRLKNEAFNIVTTEDVVIVDIDDESIEELGRPQLWPRAFDAYVLNYVSSGNPKAIAIDYLYTEPDALSPVYADLMSAKGIENPEPFLDAMSTDVELSFAIANSQKTYLALFDDETKKNEPLDWSTAENLRLFESTLDSSSMFGSMNFPVLPIDMFAEGSKGIGAINMSTHQDGTVRDYYLLHEVNTQDDQRKFLANFPLYMVMDELGVDVSQVEIQDDQINLGDSLRIPLGEEGSFRINWLGSEDEIRYIPYFKVLSGRAPAEFFEDKFIFLGTSASGMQDLKTIPSSDGLIPGAEVHAIAFLNIINQAFVKEHTDFQALPWFLLASFLMCCIFLYLRPYIGVLLAVGLAIGEMLLFISWYFPKTNSIFPIVTLMILTFISFILASLYTYLVRERKSRRLKTAFESYLSPEVVNKIADQDVGLALEGEKKRLSVLFSDIRDFTSHSEKHSPERIVATLNGYLSDMSECVFRKKGTIDKFIGDAVMAIFGAPVPQEDHADRACLVALDMINSLKLFNQNNKGFGDQPLTIGIGINTGSMTVGNFGSARRFDYTVIGDEVNLASRLEGLTKYFGVNIIISEATLRSCQTGDFVTRPLAKVRVKGKENPVEVHELVGLYGGYSPLDKSLSVWNKALKAYLAKDLELAKELFEDYRIEFPNDFSAGLYIDRCDLAIANPATYESVLTMTHK